jgi:hypothetical protein
MNNREIFIEKVMRGEKVNVDDVAQNQAQQELKAIETEAARRLDEENRRREGVEKRESQILELMRLGEEAAKIFADTEENERRKNEMLRQFAGSELEIRGKYYQTYSMFSQIFQELSGQAYDKRLMSNSVIRELKERGAVLDKVDIELVRIPLSPMAQLLSDERHR